MHFYSCIHGQYVKFLPICLRVNPSVSNDSDVNSVQFVLDVKAPPHLHQNVYFLIAAVATGGLCVNGHMMNSSSLT